MNMLRSKLKIFIIHAKKVFNSSLISSSSSHPRKLWNSINKLLHRKLKSQLPSTIDSKSLPSMFASFFSDKDLKIHLALKSRVTHSSPHTERSHMPTNLTFVSTATEEEICKLVSQSSNTFCDRDPIPTSLLKQFLPTLLSTYHNQYCQPVFELWCYSQTVQTLLSHSSSEKVQSG